VGSWLGALVRRIISNFFFPSPSGVLSAARRPLHRRGAPALSWYECAFHPTMLYFSQVCLMPYPAFIYIYKIKARLCRIRVTD